MRVRVHLHVFDLSRACVRECHRAYKRSLAFSYFVGNRLRRAFIAAPANVHCDKQLVERHEKTKVSTESV
jgi:hypothetical protein